MAVRFLNKQEVKELSNNSNSSSIKPTPRKSKVRFLNKQEVKELSNNVTSKGTFLNTVPQKLWEKTKDVFTGESRMTPEMKTLPSIGQMPELNKISTSGLRSALITMTGSDEEAVKALQTNFPGIKVRKDQKGNVIVRSSTDGKEYVVNKPGLDARDLIKTGLIAAMFSPVGKVSGTAARIGAAAAIQAGTEGIQKAAGGQFNPEEIPLAGATETITPVLKKAAIGVKSAISPSTVKTPLQRSLQKAEELGINVLTSDVKPPQGHIAKLGQAITERIPFTGTGKIRVAQKAQRAEAIRNLFREYGADQFISASDDVMDEVVKKRSADLTKYTSLKNDIISRLADKGVLNVDTTLNVIDDEIKKLTSLNTKGVKPAIDLLKDYRDAFKNQNLENIELLRRQLGQQLVDPNLAQVRSTAEKSVSKIYTAIRQDVQRFIKQNGDKKDLIKWKVSNARLSKMMDELEVNAFKSILKRGTTTPETVRKMLFSKKPSEIQLLYKNLTPEGKDRAKVAILQEVLEKAGGIDEITPAKFMNQLKKTENSIKIFFNRKDKQTFKGLMRVLELTKRAEEAVEKPLTGAELTGIVSPVILTQMFGLTPGALTYGGIGYVARLYESKPVRNLLIELSKAPPGKEQIIVNNLVSVLQAKRQLFKKKNANDS